MFNHAGQQFGNYRLIRFLGRGGCAEVYQAEHVRNYSQAAVKILQARLTSSEDLKAFINEARTFRLKHPHIVPLLDFGITDNDVPYLVMEYAPRGTLRERHPVGTRVPLTTVVSYVRQVASALQYAHNLYLIHRDVKPENMLIGEQNNILLSDFGIALIAQTTRSQNTEELAGTVGYMSPEHIQGKPRLASDQYSLGIVVYEWICGQRPFYGSFREICAQQMFASPPPLDGQVPIISPGIEWVVMHALAKNPEQRFPDIQAFAIAFEQAYQESVTITQVVVPPKITPLRPAEEPPTKPSSFPTNPPANPVISIQNINAPPLSSTKKIEEEPPTRLSPPHTNAVFTPVISHSQDRNVPPLSLTKKIEEEPPTRMPLPHINAPVNPVIPPFQDVIVPPTNSAGKITERPTEPTMRDQKTPQSDSGLARKVTAPNNLPAYTDTKQSLPNWPTPVLLPPVSPPTPVAKPHISRRTIVIGGLTIVGLVTTGIITLAEVQSIPNRPGHGTTTAKATATATRPYLSSKYPDHTASIYSLAWARDSRRIASASYDKTVRVWDSNNGNTLYVYRGHTDAVEGVTWSPDGTRIASASRDKTVQVWNAISGANAYTYAGHSDKVVEVKWSPNGNSIASTGFDTTVQIWDAVSGAHPYVYRGHFLVGETNVYVYTLSWSPDNRRIASAGNDATVRVWDVANGNTAYIYRGHSSAVFAVAWSPDGKRIASAGADKTVQVWDATNGTTLYTYKKHTDMVRGIAWSPDSLHIVSCGYDMQILLWNAANGTTAYTQTYIYQGRPHEVYAVAWSPDSKRIACGGDGLGGSTPVEVWQFA